MTNSVWTIQQQSDSVSFKTGPKVTVLISTYNRPAYLAEALESIFAQTYSNFEILLVRDGGMSVRDVVSRFDDARLTFIDRDQNRGLPYSFNEALSRATGEYVCYLGDDDKFYTHHIETLLRASLQNPAYGVVYSDLYKVHCRVLGDGRRRVLSKNVEISRDFDRLLMLQFNHALHVSLMHRRDLLDRAGAYNENLNVLIDWDLTRRLCFYADFLHVPIVTGEYYAPVGNCDRISVQRRKNVNDYFRNLLTIRTTRPSQPWAKVKDAAVLVLCRRADEALLKTVGEFGFSCFYPNRIYVPLTAAEQSRFRCEVPNVVVVGVNENDTPSQRLIRMLNTVDAPVAAILTAGITIPARQEVYMERALYPLLAGGQDRITYEIPESSETHFGAVLHTAALRDVLRRGYSADNANALRSAGLEVRKPTIKEYPFYFDMLLSEAELRQQQGQWRQAAEIYDYMARHHGNELWMRTRQANALYHAGQYTAAAQVAAQINTVRPTVATYGVEARIRKKLGDCKTAAELYGGATRILAGEFTGYLPGSTNLLIPSTANVPSGTWLGTNGNPMYQRSQCG